MEDPLMGRPRHIEQCLWCGRRFTPDSKVEPCCSVECYAQSMHAEQMIAFLQVEHKRLEEQLQLLNSRVCELWAREQRLVRRLQRLGERWRRLPAGAERNAVEETEEMVSRKLATVTERLVARDRLTMKPRYSILTGERELKRLRKRLGDD